MAIMHFLSKATVCTPNHFAMSARCKRLKRSIKAGSNLKQWLVK